MKPLALLLCLLSGCGLHIRTQRSSVTFGGDATNVRVVETADSLTVTADGVRYSPVASERLKTIRYVADRVAVPVTGTLIP
jgi:hypothetical protein